ncbi:Segregation and condensation protein B [Candidatus Calditenuaceae archaeon HR02]|nr:Segregation and condensation protein B [Candidatus Calditenuaceae archaeon HR02]
MSKKARHEARGSSEALAKPIIEAALFLSDRPLTLERLRSISGLRSRKSVEAVLEELRKEYEESGRAFTISRFRGESYMMHVKPEWLVLVKKHVGRTVLGVGALRTLSFIAYHQPVDKSTVAAVRGGRAYAQIRELVERGLVEIEKKGRTSLLRTTKLFAELLGVEDNPVAIRRKIQEAMQHPAHQSTTGEEGGPQREGE